MKNKTRLLIIAAVVFLFLIFIGFAIKFFSTQPSYDVYNMHEHIQNFEQSQKLLEVINNTRVEKIILVGSSDMTIYGKEEFVGHDENNAEILKIVNTYPNKFVAFCTINPRDEDKLEKLKDCIGEGGVGLKLYTGHSWFYDLPLNNSSMYPLYQYLEENQIPIIWHVNYPKYKEDFEAVLNDFPNLIVNCPHFCLISGQPDVLDAFLTEYPNVYTDVSFGAFAQDGFERLSKKKSEVTKVIIKHQDRFLYATDMVITDHPRKTTEWITNLTICYQDMLEKQSYYCKVGDDVDGNFTGLYLPADILKKIYHTNAKRFLEGKPPAS